MPKLVTCPQCAAALKIPDLATPAADACPQPTLTVEPGLGEGLLHFFRVVRESIGKGSAPEWVKLALCRPA